MRRLVAILILTLAVATPLRAQIYAKINALYAVVGVVNPQVEGAISPHSSLVVDATYSPWRSIGGKHAHFGIFQGEYRYYFREATKGWYISANAGIMGFDINKPRLFKGGLISLKETYSKGFGLMAGVGAGYQHLFAGRWVVDAYVAIDFVRSWYNGYKANGEFFNDTAATEIYTHPDPFNGSSEIMPIKAGVSIGYMIFKRK